MRIISAIRMELIRFLRKPFFWLTALAAALSPLAGLLYQPIDPTTKNAEYLGNPAYLGGMLGAVCFALFTLLEENRERAWEMDVLQDAVYSPFVRKTARTAALGIAAALLQVLICLAYLPWTKAHTGTAWNDGLYWMVYGLFQYFAILFAIIFVSGVYGIARRADVTLAAFAVFYLMCLNGSVRGSFILPWASPAVMLMSDDFGNMRMLMSVAYNRLFWLAALGALYLAALFVTRRYEKGILGSMKVNLKKVGMPLGAVLSGAAAVSLFLGQPFVDASPMDMDMEAMVRTGEENDRLMVERVDLDVRPNVDLGTLEAQGTWQIRNLSGEEQEAVMEFNPGYSPREVKANGKEISFTEGTESDKKKPVTFLLPADEEVILEFSYGGIPQEWSILEFSLGLMEISRESIDLAAQDLTPMPEMRISDDLQTTFRVTLPENMTPVMGGNAEIAVKQENGDGTKTWESVTDRCVLYLYAGDYVSRSVPIDNGSVELYYSQKHEKAMEEIQIGQTLQQVFDYCGKQYGSLGFGEENGLKLLETSRYLSGGYASYGMSVMDESSFSESGFSDEKRGATGQEVLAHEIIHQWWGLACQFIPDETHTEWSSEGVTVYTSYRMMKELKGEEYAKTYYLDKWKRDVSEYSRNFYVQNPQYLERLSGDLRELVTENSLTVEQYALMPLKLWKAEQILGEERMDEVLAEMFQLGFMGCTYQDFLDISGLEEEELYVEEADWL